MSDTSSCSRMIRHQPGDAFVHILVEQRPSTEWSTIGRCRTVGTGCLRLTYMIFRLLPMAIHRYSVFPVRARPSALGRSKNSNWEVVMKT